MSAASGSPSPSRSPHTNARSPATPAKGCTGRQVPSPLFLSTTGGAARTPTTMSRSPSISMSAAHAPVASIGAGPLSRDAASRLVGEGPVGGLDEQADATRARGHEIHPEVVIPVERDEAAWRHRPASGPRQETAARGPAASTRRTSRESAAKIAGGCSPSKENAVSAAHGVGGASPTSSGEKRERVVGGRWRRDRRGQPQETGERLGDELRGRRDDAGGSRETPARAQGHCEERQSRARPLRRSPVAARDIAPRPREATCSRTSPGAARNPAAARHPSRLAARRARSTSTATLSGWSASSSSSSRCASASAFGPPAFSTLLNERGAGLETARIELDCPAQVHDAFVAPSTRRLETAPQERDVARRGRQGGRPFDRRAPQRRTHPIAVATGRGWPTTAGSPGASRGRFGELLPRRVDETHLETRETAIEPPSRLLVRLSLRRRKSPAPVERQIAANRRHGHERRARWPGREGCGWSDRFDVTAAPEWNAARSACG